MTEIKPNNWEAKPDITRSFWEQVENSHFSSEKNFVQVCSHIVYEESLGQFLETLMNFYV